MQRLSFSLAFALALVACSSTKVDEGFYAPKQRQYSIAVDKQGRKDGAEIWTGTVTIGSNKWTTSTRRVLSKAGAYEVDVVGADGAALGKVEFAIQ